MWQRRALQGELGAASALIQISLGALQRYTASRPTAASPTVTYGTGSSSTSSVLLPGHEWGVSSRQRRVSIASLTLASIDADAAGNAIARWSVSLSGSDDTTKAFGKTLYGGIQADTPLGELVQRYESTYGRIGPGLIANKFGKPVVLASSTSSSTWLVTAELVTPLVATPIASSGVVSIRATSSGASLSVAASGTFPAASAADLQNELSGRLAELLVGRIPALCPDISTVGALGANETAPEAVPVYCKLRVASGHVLCVFVANAGTFSVPAQSGDLTGGADAAYLARESVIQKTLAFCLRSGRFPTHWRNETTTTSTSAGNVTIVHGLDIASASISLEQFGTSSARQEDRADLLVLIHPSILSVTMPDGSAAPAELRNQIAEEGDLNLTIDLYFSNVGTPTPNPDPQLDAWFQQWRTQVSRRFSVPFAAIAAATLLERSLNGVEKVLLTRANLVF